MLSQISCISHICLIVHLLIDSLHIQLICTYSTAHVIIQIKYIIHQIRIMHGYTPNSKLCRVYAKIILIVQYHCWIIGILQNCWQYLLQNCIIKHIALHNSPGLAVRTAYRGCREWNALVGVWRWTQMKYHVFIL